MLFDKLSDFPIALKLPDCVKIGKSLTKISFKAHLSMDRKTNRLILLIIACSAVGVILGGTSSQAQIKECQTAVTPTHECLTQDPLYKTIEGMSVGLFAGAGAALGATWQIWQKDN